MKTEYGNSFFEINLPVIIVFVLLVALEVFAFLFLKLTHVELEIKA